MKHKTNIAKCGPDKSKPKRSDECCGEMNKKISSKSTSKEPGEQRISNGSLPKG